MSAPVPVPPRRLPALRDALAQEADRIAQHSDGAKRLRNVFIWNVLRSGRMYYGTSDFCTLLRGAAAAASGDVETTIAVEPTSPLNHHGFVYLQDPVPMAGLITSSGTEVQVPRGAHAELILWGPVPTDQLSNLAGCDIEEDPEHEYTVAGILLGTSDNSNRVAVLDFGGYYLLPAANLLASPGLVELDVKQSRPPKNKKLARKARSGAVPSDVTVVNLRRQISHDLAAVAEAERTYRHRWIVRGHWRAQAHGPGRTKRRATYIAPYLKGPDSAPLLHTEKVYKW